MSDSTNIGKVFNLTRSVKRNDLPGLVHLTVVSPPDKTTYKSGESFDATGLVVQGEYDDGSTSIVTGYTIQPMIMTDGINSVTITYTENRVTKTTTVSVTVQKILTSIAVTTNPTKMTYSYGETFSPNGMVVTAYFSDGSHSVVYDLRYSTSPFNTIGDQRFQIGYGYGNTVSFAYITLTVVAVVVQIPTATTTYVYNGAIKTPEWNNYDSTIMTISGETTGDHAGTYTVTFTLNYGYVFTNGENTANKTWKILKASNTLTLSSEEVTFNNSVSAVTVTATRNGDGIISAISADNTVAQVTNINQQTGAITIQNRANANSSTTIVVSVAAGTNHNAPSDKIISVSCNFREYLYGYDLNINDSNPATRVTYPSDVDNYGYVPALTNFSANIFSYGDWPSTPGEKFMPRPCMLKFNGTVDYYLDPDDYTKKMNGAVSDIADMSYGGNAMMEWPKIYTKRWETNGVYHFRCSDVKIDEDYECWCNYDQNNNEIDHFYTAIYFGSFDDYSRMRSISGQSNIVNQDAESEVAYATLNDSVRGKWYIEVVADRFLEQDLLVMIFKSTNLQTALGTGVVDASAVIETGTMNTSGMFWGDRTKTNGVKAFGMENLWGNLYRRTAGWGYKGGTQYLKLTRGTKDGSTATDYNMDGSGYLQVFATISASGYIKTMQTQPYGRLPLDCSGSNTTYETGHISRGGGSTNFYYALVGGCWRDDLYAGLFATYLASTPFISSQYYGAALSCKPLSAGPM